MKDMDKILTVLWCVSFDRNLFSNWMGVGLWNKKDFDEQKGIKNIFNIMWNGKAKCECFQRIEISDELTQVSLKVGQFTILGEMDKSKKSKISVTLKPNFLKDAYNERQ